MPGDWADDGALALGACSCEAELCTETRDRIATALRAAYDRGRAEEREALLSAMRSQIRACESSPAREAPGIAFALSTFVSAMEARGTR